MAAADKTVIYCGSRCVARRARWSPCAGNPPRVSRRSETYPVASVIYRGQRSHIAQFEIDRAFGGVERNGPPSDW
jgi:hypothetical protein